MKIVELVTVYVRDAEVPSCVFLHLALRTLTDLSPSGKKWETLGNLAQKERP